MLLSGMDLGMELLGYMVSLCLNEQLPDCVSQRLERFTFPPAIHKSSNFSISLPTLVTVFLIIVILVGVKWYLIIVLIDISSMTFYVFIGHSVSS
jgi:hypothetical protein